MGYPVRPSGYMGWGSTGFTNAAEPLDTKKNTGWAIGEKPASSYFNWIQQKQDQWIQYLDWRSRLRPAKYDDFCQGSWNLVAAGPSALAPDWYAYTPPAVLSNWSQVNPGPGSAGSIWSAFQKSGYAEIQGHIGTPGNRDFRMEHVVALTGRATGAVSFEMGLMIPNEFQGSTGGDMRLGWMTTGATGALFARWVPSGQNPTAYNLGGMPSNASGYHRYTVEGRSPTMAFYIDDALKFAAPMVEVDALSAQLNLGVRIGGQSGLFGVQVDLMEFSLAR